MSEGETPESAENRRAYPRSPVVVREARCISGIDVFFGYAKNISRSGLFIATPKLRTPGDTYEIQFKLPGIEHEFKCSGLIKWVRHYRHNDPNPPGFGVKFTELSEEDGKLIDQWVGECEGTNPAEE